MPDVARASSRAATSVIDKLADDDAVVIFDNTDELLDLDAALTKLAVTEPELARLVELRFFAGLTVEEAAQAMGISTRTVKRNWAFARAWLGREMNSQSSATKKLYPKSEVKMSRGISVWYRRDH